MNTTALFATALGAVLVLSLASLAVSAFGPGEQANYEPAVHDALQDAMENGDFDAWRAIREENGLPMRGRMMRSINAENFDRFLALREANLDGDLERAQEIREELGVGRGPHRSLFSEERGFGQRSMRGNCVAWTE